MVETLDEVAQIINKIMISHPAVDKVAIFGSFARGEQTNKSDIDLMLVKKTGYSMGFEFYGIIDEIEEASGRHVDLLSYNSVRVLDFGSEILKGAKYIYDSSRSDFKTHKAVH